MNAITLPYPPSTKIKRARPGSGWKHIAGPVYEHANGTRMHLNGIVKTIYGEFISAAKWPASQFADKYIRMNGGNRKRGLMAFAMHLNGDAA